MVNGCTVRLVAPKENSTTWKTNAKALVLCPNSLIQRRWVFDDVPMVGPTSLVLTIITSVNAGFTKVLRTSHKVRHRHPINKPDVGCDSLGREDWDE